MSYLEWKLNQELNYRKTFEKDDEFYKGEFLVTQLRHTFSQDERRHTMYMNVMKDSIPVEFKNVAVSSEPVNAKSQVINY